MGWPVELFFSFCVLCVTSHRHRLQNLVGCDFIPQMYSGILNEGVCNNIQPGITQIGVGCIIGVGFLLVALSMRSVFFGDGSNDDTVEDGDGDGNADKVRAVDSADCVGEVGGNNDDASGSEMTMI